MKPPARSLSPLLVGSLVLLAVGALVHRVLQEPVDVGYVRYLGIADEIARSGDWVVLRVVDNLYLDKPPLFFWLVAAPISWLGGAPNWVAHVPGLLALGLSVASVHRLARELYGPGEPALAAALLFATTWETFNQATGKRLDPVFAAFLTAAFTCFFLGSGGLRRGALRPGLLAGAFVFVALATLTKGPLGILFFLLGAGIFAAWTGRLRVFASRGSLTGIALLALLCASWPILLGQRLGFDETLAAYSAKTFTTRRANVLVYLANLPVQGLPWCAFYPALVVALFRRHATRGSDGLRFLLAWFLAVFVPLHFSEARHSRYLIPATPALSLLLVSLWYRPLDATEALPALATRLRRYGSTALYVVLGVAGLVAGLGLAGLGHEPFTGRAIPPERVLAAPLALAIGAAAVLGLRSALRRGAEGESLLPLASLLVGVTTVFSLLAGGDFHAQDRTPRAREALAPATAGRPTALYGLTEEQLQLSRLLTRRALPSFQEPADVLAWARAAEDPAPLVLASPEGRIALEAQPGFRPGFAGVFELAQNPVEILTLEATSQPEGYGTAPHPR